MQSRSENVSFIWSSPDQLRDPCKCGEYHGVIMPLIVPPRLHDVLEQEILGTLREVAG